MMHKHIFTKYLVKFLGAGSIIFTFLYLNEYFFSGLWLKFVRVSKFYSIMNLLILLCATCYFLIQLFPLSVKTKMFKKRKSIDSFIEIILGLQMVASFSALFIDFRLSYFFFNIQNIHFYLDLFLALFFVSIYMQNKYLISKLWAYISGAIYIVIKLINVLVINNSLKFDALYFQTIFIVATYIALSALYPRFKNAVYFKEYDDCKIEDKSVKITVLSAYRNDKGEIEELVSVKGYGLAVFNLKTNDVKFMNDELYNLNLDLVFDYYDYVLITDK